jgi:hypothetical protein
MGTWVLAPFLGASNQLGRAPFPIRMAPSICSQCMTLRYVTGMKRDFGHVEAILATQPDFALDPLCTKSRAYTANLLTAIWAWVPPL